MSQYTWTNPGSYWSDRQPRSWTQAPNPNLFGGGVEPFYQNDWPLPPRGYPYPTALRTTTAQHPPWTVWNPNDKFGTIVLSGGNLDATIGVAGLQGVRATSSSASTGQYYWEITVVSRGGLSLVGISTVAFDLSSSAIGSASTGGGVGFRSDGGTSAFDGTVRINNAVVATLTRWNTGDVIRVACDFANKRIWFAVNAGYWNDNPRADPSLNLGGLSWSGLSAGGYFPTVQGNPALGNTELLGNFGATAFTYAATQPSGFIGWDGQLGAATVSQVPFTLPAVSDALAPRGAKPAQQAQEWYQNLLTTTLAAPPVAPPPFQPSTDLPRGYPYPIGLRTQTPSLNPNLSGGGIAPFAQTDWPNPRGYVPASTLRTHTDATRLQLIGQDTIYGAPGQGVPNYDWPVPKGPRAGIDLRSWAQSLLQSTLAPGSPPPFQPAGPVPRGYAFAVSLRTHLDPTRIQLIGQDRIYGGPGQGVPNYDWPVPKGRIYPTSLRTWTQDLLQSTIAPLVINPRKQTDWPNPRGYPYPVSLRGFINPTITMRNAVQWATIDDPAAPPWLTISDPATPTWTTIADPATQQWTEIPEN